MVDVEGVGGAAEAASACGADTILLLGDIRFFTADLIGEGNIKIAQAAEQTEKARAAAEERRNGLKAVLKELGQWGAATPAQQKAYERMAGMYSGEIILLAARECAAKQKQFDSVMKLLESWQERGFTTEEEIREHIEAFHGKEEFLKSLRQKWAGRDTDIGQKTLQMLDKWENRLNFSREMIALAADEAWEAKKPIAYMDRLLGSWAEKGIRTPEAAAAEKKARGEQPQAARTGKPVAAQQYVQRDYDGEQEEARQRMLAGILNGGEEDA